jgi:hypothetical protein
MRDRIRALYARRVRPLRGRGMGTADYLIALGVAAALLLPVFWQALGAVRDLMLRFLEAIR